MTNHTDTANPLAEGFLSGITLSDEELTDDESTAGKLGDS
jgi:hypothetical protein